MPNSIQSTVDMHAHSNCSDGSMSPEELILHAKDRGLEVIALTDHDTTIGIDRARKQAQICGIRLIPGVELSTRSHDREIHILGYYCDMENQKFCDTLADLQTRRRDKNLRILRHMQADGIPVTMEQVSDGIADAMVTRAHFAGYLVKIGMATSMKDAFLRFMNEGRPYYEPKVPYDTVDAVRLIRQAGGLAYLAHPGLARLDDDSLDQLVKELKEAGLNGIEVYHSRHTEEATAYAKELARRYDLAISGGSDYHAKNKPDIELGVGLGNLVLTNELVEQLDALR